MKPISGELVAAKLHSIKNRECDAPKGVPRFAEILWMLQDRSWQPGGLPALAKLLVSEYPEKVGQEVFWEFGRKWTADQCVTVWEKVKKWYEVRSWFPNFADWASLNVGGPMAPDALKAGCINYNFDYFNRQSRLLACDELSRLS